MAKELALKEYEKCNQHRLEIAKKDDFDIYLEEHESVKEVEVIKLKN